MRRRQIGHPPNRRAGPPRRRAESPWRTVRGNREDRPRATNDAAGSRARPLHARAHPEMSRRGHSVVSVCSLFVGFPRDDRQLLTRRRARQIPDCCLRLGNNLRCSGARRNFFRRPRPRSRAQRRARQASTAFLSCGERIKMGFKVRARASTRSSARPRSRTRGTRRERQFTSPSHCETTAGD